ncbi:MAG: Trk system potassium transporter TrkA [Pseudomonadota bacterium]|nr:Trk system potassium transporter TrkA [Pseudomonadota bacterium]
MNIIICGAGEVGYSLAKYLSSDNMKVTLIDESIEKLEKISATIDVRTLVGKSYNPEILSQANIEEAELIISVTDNDETNILTCEISKILFKIPTTIARIKEKEFLNEKWVELFSDKGFRVDYIISPEDEVASMLARLVAVSGAHDLISFAEDKVRLIGFKLDKDCPVLNTPLKELTELFPNLNTKIVLMVRNEKTLIPNKMEELEEGDDIYLLSDSNNINRVLNIFGKKIIKSRRVVIIGAGIIALSIAKILEINEPDSSITVIENDKETAERAAMQLEKANVLLGDAVEPEIIQEAEISKADIVFSVTNSDEINTLVSTLSKKAGAKNCYALLNGDKYLPVISLMDIDGIISPKELTVSKVLKYIRRGDVTDVYELQAGKAEIIEFLVKEGSRLVGIPLKDAKLPENTIIGSIARQNTVVTPTGDTIIETGDKIVMCLLHEAIHKLEDFLSNDPELI